MEDETRIQTPTPRRPRQSCQRRQSHARIPTLPILHHARARSTPQMQRNNIRLFFLLPQKLRYTPRNKRIGNPMESIFSQPILLRNLLINRIRTDMFWNRSVELRIKDGDVARRWQMGNAVLDNGQCGRVVQRR